MAEVLIQGLMYPSSLEFDDSGGVFVAEAGFVYGDPSAPARVVHVSAKGDIHLVADRLNGPVTDILWHQSRLTISHCVRISVVEKGKVRDLVTGLPSRGDHFNNQMCIGPDGLLYFGQGTATNSGVVGFDN